MKLLCKQGLPHRQLGIVFQAIFVLRAQYVISAWGGFLTAYLMRQTDAFFLRPYRCGFVMTLHLLAYYLLPIKLYLSLLVNLSISSVPLNSNFVTNSTLSLFFVFSFLQNFVLFLVLSV